MEERERKHFTDSLVYLMHETVAYCRARTEQFFDQSNLGLTLNQYLTLDMISINSGICQRDLAKILLKERSYVTRMIESLEGLGFIERIVDIKGKRPVKKLFLTPKAESVLKAYQEPLKDLFYNDIFRDISSEELNQIRLGLEKIKACVQKSTVITV